MSYIDGLGEMPIRLLSNSINCLKSRIKILTNYSSVSYAKKLHLFDSWDTYANFFVNLNLQILLNITTMFINSVKTLFNI